MPVPTIVSPIRIVSPIFLLLTACMLAADPPTPALDLRTRTPEYLGPGREVPPPEGLTEIHVAFFGPGDAEHPEYGDAWRGAALALDEANAAGGYRGVPFRLVSAWSDSPWAAGVADLARLTYEQAVWAIVGGVDGASTHLAEQVALKARLALVSPGGTDASVNFTNVAWMFSLLATDDVQAPLIAQALVDGGAGQGWSVVTTTDRDAASAWRMFKKAPALRALPAPSFQLILERPQTDDAATIADVVGGHNRAILVMAGARDAARIVRTLRAAGFHGRIVGGATLGRRVFGEEAGAAAEGAQFPLLFDDTHPEAAAFVSRYRERWKTTPDYLAAHSYDAVRLVTDAIRRAGPNRALIRDALAQTPTWPGVTGPIGWDSTGRNTRLPTVGVWRAGLVQRAPDIGVPKPGEAVSPDSSSR
jgi:branched-chain amino acid transport system substrate-binding protein